MGLLEICEFSEELLRDCWYIIQMYNATLPLCVCVCVTLVACFSREWEKVRESEKEKDKERKRVGERERGKWNSPLYNTPS